MSIKHAIVALLVCASTAQAADFASIGRMMMMADWHPDPDGLVFWWPFLNTPNDYSGAGRTATLNRSATATQYGLRMSIPTNDAPPHAYDMAHYVGSDTSTMFTTGLTYSAWVFFTNTFSEAHFAGRGVGGTSVRFRRSSSTYWLSDRLMRVDFGGTGPARELQSLGPPIPTNQWVHVSLTWQAGVGYRLYYDAQLVHATNTAFTALYTTPELTFGDTYSTNFWVGGGRNSSFVDGEYRGFPGYMADVFIYNTAQPQSLIGEIYSNTISRRVTP